MNQKVEQALIDYSNDVWDRAMKAGALAEQERIVKLLEEWPICDESCYCLPCNLGETEMIRKEFTNLLAEIKGKK